jgi:hypothetical protein
VGGLYARHQEVHGSTMFRLLATFLVVIALATAAEKTSVIGKVQPEIRLTDGTVFTKAKIVEYSVEKSTATIAEPTRVRVVPLNTLPPKLRDQILSEAGVKPPEPRPHPTRPIARPLRPPLAAGPSNSEPPTATTAPQPLEQLLEQAVATAPAQLKAHPIRTYGVVSNVSTKFLDAGEVPGWPQIRVSGETSFAEWSPGQRASSLHREKFDVVYTMTDGVLKPETVTVGGISRPVTP